MKALDTITIIGYFAAFGTTVSFLPQAIKTIQTKILRAYHCICMPYLPQALYYGLFMGS